MNDPVVSVIMISYNHEPYIRKAIESVLMQKTSFPFEIIIHDDASTDNSATIIREYAQKYPDKIVPILQTENKYSKNISIRRHYINPRIRGKYIATCECDDYWIGENKLQFQVDFLESHPEFSGCTHNCLLVDKAGNEFATQYSMYKRCKEHVYKLADAGIGAYFPGQTAALVYKKSALEFSNQEEEEDYYMIRTGSGDIVRNFLLLLKGDIYYFEPIMSAHRVVRDGGDSWSARVKGKNLSFERFASSRDMRKYAWRHYHRRFRNYYTTLRACINGIWCFIKKPNDINKQKLRKMIEEVHGLFVFVLYFIMLFIFSLPLIFQRHMVVKVRYL